LLPVRKRSPEHGQTVRFQIAIAGAFICDVSGGRGAIEQQFLLPVVARLDLQNSACQPQPARCIVGGDSDKLAEDQHAHSEVVLLEGGVGIAAQGYSRLIDGGRVAFYLRFELDGSLVESTLLEGFFGRERRRQEPGTRRQGRREQSEAWIESSRSSGSPPEPFQVTMVSSAWRRAARRCRECGAVTQIDTLIKRVG
jgi:hypothetical protein